jgi:hypothetical protein
MRGALVLVMALAATAAASAPAQAANQSHSADWALDRLDQLVPQYDDHKFRWHDGTSGNGATIFVLSNGPFSGDDLGGRAGPSLGFGGSRNADPNLDPECSTLTAEGASLASLAAGSSYGVAKDASVRYLQIADCALKAVTVCGWQPDYNDIDGDGNRTELKWQCWTEWRQYQRAIEFADVTEAVNWVTANRSGPAVGVLDFTHLAPPATDVAARAAFDAMNLAVSQSVAAGVTWVVPCCDYTTNPACDYGPAHLGDALDGVITVGATNSNDAYVGGGGPCIDIYGPGLNVPSLTPVAGATRVAAAFTAGVIAQYQEPAPNWTPAELENWLKSQATSGVVTGRPANSPNLLLHSAWWGPVLRLTCENKGTSEGNENFECVAVQLNGAFDTIEWQIDPPGPPFLLEDRPALNNQDTVTDTCDPPDTFRFRVKMTRFNHSEVKTFSLTCALSP